MKKTLVVYGSSTGTCQSIAETIAEKLGAEVVDVANLDDAQVNEAENLILGTSTWGAGEVQDDWYDGLNKLKKLDLNGKSWRSSAVATASRMATPSAVAWTRFILPFRTRV